MQAHINIVGERIHKQCKIASMNIWDNRAETRHMAELKNSNVSGKSSLCLLCYANSNHHRQHCQEPTLPPRMSSRLLHKARNEPLGAILGASWSPLGALLRPSWGTLGGSRGGPGVVSGASWGFLKSSQHEGDVECDLGATWSRLGALLVPSWGPLWAVLGPSWPILGPLGAILGSSWGHLGASWGPLGSSWGQLGGILAA